jgi:hypothetical protein
MNFNETLKGSVLISKLLKSLYTKFKNRNNK